MKQLSSVSPPTRSISGLQLAKKLGLSHATVSFVLNGIGEKRKISKATIDRVLATAKRYNYAPNRFGNPALRSGPGLSKAFISKAISRKQLAMEMGDTGFAAD
jgi:LacI family transcriptional regulator